MKSMAVERKQPSTKRTSAADVTEAALAVIVAAKGGTPRPGQIMLARTTANAIARKIPAITQAGTGTGKTFGYGVPALLSGRKTLIATHTKALQAQLLTDMAFLADTMSAAGLLPNHPRIAVLKGRRAYACMAKVSGQLDTPTGPDNQLRLPVPEAKTHSAAPQRLSLEVISLRRWAEHETETGDQSEVPFPHSAAAWDQVAVSPEDCIGKNCPLLEVCYSKRARDIADEADVVIINQAMLAIDMKMDGVVLPAADVVIVDEGHELESVIANTFGAKLSIGRLRQVAARCKKHLPDSSTVSRALGQLNVGIESFRQLPAADEPDRKAAETQPVKATLSALHNAIDGLHGSAASAFKQDRENTALGMLTQSLAALEQDLDLIGSGNTDRRVVWAATDNEGAPTLHTAMFDVSQTAHDALLSRYATVLLTSATLTVGGSFRHAVHRLGFDRLADGRAAPGRDILLMDAPSPFDFSTQGRVWLPPGPHPRDTDYNQHVADVLAKVITAAGGRTLGLFTSWRALEETYELLAQALPTVRILLQEPGQSTSQLTRAFTDDAAAVLLGTRTFMTGISVEGPSCAAVVIDRLPFPSPGEPITAARAEAAGPAGFESVFLAETCITLAQAAGRLIRTVSDRGVIVLCDARSRPAGPHYSATIRASLPPMPLCSQEQALALLTDIHTQAINGQRPTLPQQQNVAKNLGGWDDES